MGELDPNLGPPAEDTGELHPAWKKSRAVGVYEIDDGRQPSLEMLVKCPTCGREDVVNIYLGVPLCTCKKKGHKPIMRAIEIVRQT